MERKGLATVVILIIAIIILVGGGVWYYDTHRPHNLGPVLISTNETTTASSETSATSTASSTSSALATNASTAITCGTDFSDFAVPPLPTSTYSWIPITEANTTSVSVVPYPFSSSTGEIINSEPFWASPFKLVSTTLEGQGWYSPGSTQIPQSYYQSILTEEGWTGQLNIASETIYGMNAGGYHGIVWGLIKVQDGYFRAMELDELSGAPDPTNVNMFISDIVPVSQIIPGYLPACPAVSVENSNSQANTSPPAPYPPIWGEYHVSLPDSLILVDSEGRRTGEDPITGTIYDEIPGTSYIVIGPGSGSGAGELFTSNLPSGQYKLYLLGGATGSYWIDLSHDGTAGQLFQGTIQTNAMISFVQNYDTSNLASSTFSTSTTYDSFKGLTVAPPNNWTPPSSQ